MILITGAAGFIGSYVASGLHKAGHEKLILADDFTRPDKASNYQSLPDAIRIDRSGLLTQLENYAQELEYVIHLGARTDTAEQDWQIFLDLNLNYSQEIWKFCTQFQIPLIYASSAATYGDGSLGFSDELSTIPQLKPLNPYGPKQTGF